VLVELKSPDIVRGFFALGRSNGHVRVGSNQDLDAPKRNVPFAPINGHHQLGAARQISA
jgi:hypothetical protein